MDSSVMEAGGQRRYGSDEGLVLDSMIRRVAQVEASRIAVVGREREITYNQLDTAIDYVAYGLVKQGIKVGTRVALYMHNIPEFIISFYAVLRVGGVVVPINPFYQGQDLAHFLENSGTYAILTIAPYYPRIEEVRRYLPRLRWVMALSGRAPQPAGTLSWEELTDSDLADPLQSLAEPDNLAVLAYTSGTSGVPKGVRLSHRNLITNCSQFEQMRQVSFGWDQEEREEISEVALIPMGLTNLYALNIGLNLSMKIGAKVVISERFEPYNTLELLQTHKATILHGTPTIFDSLLKVAPPPAENLRRDVFRSLRYAFSYGLKLPKETFHQFADRVRRLPIHECYGVTEAGPVIASTAAAPSARVNSIGWPLPGAAEGLPGVELRLVDVTNPRQDVAVGAIGEFIVRGDNMLQDYFDLHEFEREQAAREAGDLVAPPRQRWLPTGDMGTVDTEGYYYVLDRKEDALIRANGDILLPVTIEDILAQHPAVKEVAAVKVSDASGPHFEAYVVLKEGSNRVTDQELIQFCRKGRNLPEYQIPNRIYFLEFLPRLRSNWRVMRRALANRSGYTGQ